jgi:hypothetical protein
VWGGLPYADLDTMATMIAATSWGGPANKLIIFSNEAAGPIVTNENCFKEPAGYTKVPSAISWISFDFYNPPGSFVMAECEHSQLPASAHAGDEGDRLPLSLLLPRYDELTVGAAR